MDAGRKNNGADFTEENPASDEQLTHSLLLSLKDNACQNKNPSTKKMKQLDIPVLASLAVAHGTTLKNDKM